MKYYNPEAKPRRRQEKIGPADDIQDSDGVNVFSYREAHQKALDWFPKVAKESKGLPPDPEPEPEVLYTVADACRDYLKDYEELGKKDLKGTTSTIDAHILVEGLKDRPLVNLTYKEIKAWHRALAKKPARGRTRKGEDPKARKLEDPAEVAKRKGIDIEEVKKDRDRARKSTANRILTVLKAVLNHAVKEGVVSCSKDPWANVVPFPNVEKARARFLTREEQIAIVKASKPAFRKLVQAALFTGARFGELARLKVGDWTPETSLLYVMPDTKTYTDRYVSMSQEGKDFLNSLVDGKSKKDRLLVREDGSIWKKSGYDRDFEEALKIAAVECPSLEDPPTFHEFRHTYASGMIQRGAHLMVVAAQLGHRSTRMVEKHYGHLRRDHVTAVVEANSPTLGITDPKLFE